MAAKLLGKRVAILAADGFEQVELTKPRAALDEAGARTSVVSIKPGKIQRMNHADKGDTVAVERTLDEARPEDFDALMIPGGLMNPDTLRSSEEAIKFVRHFFREGKPVAAICHPPGSRSMQAISAVGPSLPGLRSRLMSGTRARRGWTRKSSWTTAWSRAEDRTTSWPSTQR